MFLFYPTTVKGTANHMAAWMKSRNEDLVYKNTNFDSNTPENEQVAVYFVHGTADGNGAFLHMADHLIKQTLPKNVVSFHLAAFKGRGTGLSIDAFTKQLAEKITANKHKQVIFVSHSRGGLICANFSENHAEHLNVKVLLNIGIGVPVQGSQLAILFSWFSTSVQEMQVGSQFLTELQQKITQNTKSAYFFIAIKNDGIVNFESSYLPDYVGKHPESLYCLKKHGHISATHSNLLIDLVIGLLYKYSDFTPAASLAGKWQASLNIHDDYEKEKTTGAQTKISNFEIIEEYQKEEEVKSSGVDGLIEQWEKQGLIKQGPKVIFNETADEVSEEESYGADEDDDSLIYS